MADPRALVTEVERRAHPSGLTEVSALELDLAAALKEMESHRDRLAASLAGVCGDEVGECVACGGSAVGDPDEHFEGCRVKREITGVRSGQPHETTVAGEPASPTDGPIGATGLGGKSRLARLRAFFSSDLAPLSTPDLPWGLSVAARIPNSALHRDLAGPAESAPDGFIPPAHGEYDT